MCRDVLVYFLSRFSANMPNADMAIRSPATVAGSGTTNMFVKSNPLGLLQKVLKEAVFVVLWILQSHVNS